MFFGFYDTMLFNSAINLQKTQWIHFLVCPFAFERFFNTFKNMNLNKAKSKKKKYIYQGNL